MVKKQKALACAHTYTHTYNTQLHTAHVHIHRTHASTCTRRLRAVTWPSGLRRPVPAHRLLLAFVLCRSSLSGRLRSASSGPGWPPLSSLPDAPHPSPPPRPVCRLCPCLCARLPPFPLQLSHPCPGTAVPPCDLGLHRGHQRSPCGRCAAVLAHGSPEAPAGAGRRGPLPSGTPAGPGVLPRAQTGTRAQLSGQHTPDRQPEEALRPHARPWAP